MLEPRYIDLDLLGPAETGNKKAEGAQEIEMEEGVEVEPFSSTLLHIAEEGGRKALTLGTDSDGHENGDAEDGNLLHRRSGNLQQ